MDLHQITANIRLRSAWEAVDLGFVMVQEWWKSLYLPLSILILAIAIPLFFFLPEKDYWIGGLIIWWLKPVYDRLMLHIISHKLFNEELTTTEALKALPSLIWNTGLFQTLTFRRFSLSRGFNLPIWQLEQLRGKKRSERQSLLHITAHSNAVWMTIGLWLIEVILLLCLFALLLMFLPSDMAADFFEGVVSEKPEYQRWIDTLNSFFYVAVVILVHPFYIAGNFALYINRRTELEAWDIELEFKKMGQRFNKINENKLITSKLSLSALLVAVALLFSGLQTTPIFADETIEYLSSERKQVDQSRQVIDEVMLTKYLDDKRKETKWVKIDKDEDEKEDEKNDTNLDWLKNILEPIGQFFAVIFEYALWIGIAIGIFLIIYHREKWLYLFQGGRKKSKDSYVAPEVMFGMDVRPESLPEDIITSAQNLWLEAKHRDSLSLLYRGALVRLINQEKVELASSHTEGDVLKHSTKKLAGNSSINTNKLDYLTLLTRQWQTIAYAHRTPKKESMQTLFTNWHTNFAVNTPTEKETQAGDE